MSKTINELTPMQLLFPTELTKELEDFASKTSICKTDIVRMAVVDFLEKRRMGGKI